MTFASMGQMSAYMVMVFSNHYRIIFPSFWVVNIRLHRGRTLFACAIHTNTFTRKGVFAMKGGLEMKVQGLKTSKAAPAAEYKEGNQKGSLLLEAIVVLGMIATFTPMLYKHVADRRADIENINRANTLLYLQHKAEDYLKDPDNITALVEELGHNQHKEIYPSEMGAGSNFDGRYIVGIRREDENNKPVLKAMIIDTVHTGSDLRAAKVAELIGISAGIYTAVDPDAAWGINGIWSEPLSRYFDTTNIPTGAVAITTEYNKAKYRVNISDILVDADLDMGEFEVTAEQINAVAIAAENGTLDQLIASNEVTSPKISATERFCFKKENGTEDCIESWEGLGGGDNALTDYQLVVNCNMGDEMSCQMAYVKDLNRTCSSIKNIFTMAGFGGSEGATPVYRLTYGTGNTYEGYVRTQCGGTQFVVSDIMGDSITGSVSMVGDSAFTITTPGWYQITLMGEAGYWTVAGGYTSSIASAAGGILIANTYYDADTLITLKGIKMGSWDWAGGGAGVALWDTINTSGAPTLVAGGGSVIAGGGGYNGGYTANSGTSSGYSWNGTTGNNTTYCNSATCNIGATGGRSRYGSGSSGSYYGYGGTGTGASGYPCPTGYTCTTITGGNAMWDSTLIANYPASTYGNWGTNTLTGGKGYASIRWCGPSGSSSSCPDTCSTDSDCSGDTPFCNNGFCSETQCSTDANCSALYPSKPYCVEGICAPYNSGRVMYEVNNISTRALSANIADVGSYTIASPGKYKISLYGEAGYSSGHLNEYGAAGGVIKVAKIFGSLTTIKIKGVKGCFWSNEHWGGAGIAMYENDSVKLVAGGGAGWTEFGGGGYIGGYGIEGKGSTPHHGSGIVSGTSTKYCTSAFCSDEAYGGRCYSYSTTWGWYYGYGGSGYCDSSYCSAENSYEIIPGGNCLHWGGYSTTTYGNWGSTTLTGGAGYASIIYCGPDANSTCP